MGTTRAVFAVPPHLEDPSGTVAIWFTDPPGSVMQFVRAGHGTVEIARWLVGPALEKTLQRFPGKTKLRLVMDLSLMTGRDPAARAVLVETTKKFRERIALSTIIPPQNASVVYLAALNVSVSLLQVFGVPIEVQTRTNALLTLRPAP